jgi:Vitamin K-dependent gamma-carboxylase
MAELTFRQKLVVGFIALWIGIQILVPLRYFLYPGNVSWTEEGHRFAWMMKLRARVCASLNGRPPALLIDPERDLARVERNLRHADWILPLELPFERPEPRTGRVDLRC